VGSWDLTRVCGWGGWVGPDGAQRSHESVRKVPPTHPPTHPSAYLNARYRRLSKTASKRPARVAAAEQSAPQQVAQAHRDPHVAHRHDRRAAGELQLELRLGADAFFAVGPGEGGGGESSMISRVVTRLPNHTLRRLPLVRGRGRGV